MASIHSAIRKGLKRIPSAALEQVLQRKLKNAGVRQHRVVAEGLAAHLLSGSDEPFEWGSAKSNDVIHLSFDEKDEQELERISAKIVATIPDLVLNLSKQVAQKMAYDFSEEWKRVRYQEERELRAFRDRLEDRWGEGLDALRVLLEVSRQLGAEAHQRLGSSKAQKGKAVRATLIQLHIRACQIGAEILALLENGFADGALARWRTLHEVAIVALLISDADDDDLATRYLDHEVVESKKALDRFLIDHAELGFRAPANREVERTKRAYEKILAKYGPSYRHQYGWASKLLNMDRPRFIDLQVAAGKSAMHSHYKMASYNVHATPKALTLRIGDLNGASTMIAGASNAGLEEAGIKLASTLALVNYTLPSGKYKIDNAITLSALANLRDKAVMSLVAADRILREDDREVRRAIKIFEAEENLDNFEGDDT